MRSLEQFGGNNLIVGCSHSYMHYFSLSGSGVPANEMHPADDFFVVDISSEAGDIDALLDITDSNLVENSGYLQRFQFVCLERTTGVFEDQHSINAAFHNLFRLLKPGGLALLYKCGRHQLETVIEVALRFFSNVKVILSGVNEVWSLYLSDSDIVAMTLAVRNYCRIINADFERSACHQEQVLRQQTPFGALDSGWLDPDLSAETIRSMLHFNRGFWASESLERNLISQLESVVA
ncbi:class I SAM-dependent methyltransferase [Spongorhabdus nitratireducens]